MKRFLVLACAAAMTLTLGACQDSTNPSAVLSGTYTLRSVNNASLPVVVSADPTVTTEWLAGSITLDRNGNYTDVVTVRESYSNGAAPYVYDDPIYGTWYLSGDQLTLTNPDYPNDPHYATVSNGQLIFTYYSDNGAPYTVLYSK